MYQKTKLQMQYPVTMVTLTQRHNPDTWHGRTGDTSHTEILEHSDPSLPRWKQNKYQLMQTWRRYTRLIVSNRELKIMKNII